MAPRYQDIYPEPPIVRSLDLARNSARDLLTLEYFEAEAAAMPEDAYEQHHIMLNLKPTPMRIENWRDGVHHDSVFHPYDVVVTPAGVRSGWRWYERSKVIVITLEPDKFARFAQVELGILLDTKQLLDVPRFVDAELCGAAVMLRDALEAETPGSEVVFEALARVFLVKLVNNYGARAGKSGGLSARQFQWVLDFIEENYGSTIRVEELARAAALSPAHFARLFRQSVGTTPSRYVTAYRIERAKKLLPRSDRTLTSIAIECGFSDQAHFTRVFKKQEGVTPNVWRTSGPS